MHLCCLTLCGDGNGVTGIFSSGSVLAPHGDGNWYPWTFTTFNLYCDLPLTGTETSAFDGRYWDSYPSKSHPSRGRKLTFYTTEVPTPPAWSYPSQGRKQVLDYYFALERFCLNPCGDGNLPYAALHRQSFPRLTPHGDGNNQCGIYFLLDNVYVLPLTGTAQGPRFEASLFYANRAPPRLV